MSLTDATNPSKTASKLNSLIETLHDSHDGYKECATETKNLKLKVLFQTLASTRESQINTLQQEVTRLYKEPAKSGTMLGAAHRLFVDLKSMLTGRDNEAIINEIRRGENHLIENYREAIQSEIYVDIKPLLVEQLQTIEKNLQTINTQAIFETETV